MTEHRALKQAIRRRMAETGEKCTEARRAVLDRTKGGHPDPSAGMPLDIREAARLGHNYIGCEHLLLGILAADEDPAAQVLIAHGVTLEVARGRTAEVGVSGGRDFGGWRLSPRATIVGKLAEVEAERLGQLEPRHAHTVLAMITEGGGVPMALFEELGVDVGKLRDDLLDTLDVPDDVRNTYLTQRIASEEQQARRCSAAD